MSMSCLELAGRFQGREGRLLPKLCQAQLAIANPAVEGFEVGTGKFRGDSFYNNELLSTPCSGWRRSHFGGKKVGVCCREYTSSTLESECTAVRQNRRSPGYMFS